MHYKKICFLNRTLLNQYCTQVVHRKMIIYNMLAGQDTELTPNSNTKIRILSAPKDRTHPNLRSAVRRPFYKKAVI